MIGRLPFPLLVPNVLDSSGGLVHGGTLVLPCAVPDHGNDIALTSAPDLLAALSG